MSNKKEFVGGYVDEKLKKELAKIAKADDRSLNYTIEKILRLGVQHRRKRKVEEAA